jgi:hypothetical protein
MLPFTGSHPAAVLPLLRPLRRLGVPPSALVVGSLAPDLPFYVTVTSITEQTHSLAGAVSMDVAVGALALTAWQLLGRPATDVLLPGLRAPLIASADNADPRRPWRRLLAIAFGLAVGALTHVIWDSFTHPGMWGVRQLPWLAESYGPLPGHEWAQYTSSVVGLIVLAVWGARRRPRPPVVGGAASPLRRAVRARTMVGGATLAGAALGVWIGIEGEADPVRGAVFLAATWGGSAGFLVVAAIGTVAAVSTRSPRAGAAAPLTEDPRAAGRDSPSAR